MNAGNISEPAAELTIAPLREEPSEIARFIASVYGSYPHGKSFVPCWTGPFLKHVIFDDPDFTPDHALGAYLGNTLVGLVMAQPYVVHCNVERINGIYGSWMAITPEGAAHFAAIRLLAELKVRHQARGAKFMVGVAYRSGPGVGLDFWEGYARTFPKDISQGRDLTFWARVLNGSALAAAVHDPLLKMAGHAARLRPVLKPRPDPGVREFGSGDLERCQDLLRQSPARMRTAPTLWQLQSAPDIAIGPQTLVVDRGAGVVAVSMFHVLPMSDAKPLAVGMIDHLVSEHGSKDQHRLLAATLWRMKQAGACLALMPRKPHIESGPLLLAGFVPYAADFKMFLLPYDEQLPANMPASYDLLVR
jgi:hypothetical protein